MIIKFSIFFALVSITSALLLNKLIPESLQLLQPAANSWSYPGNSMGIIYNQPAPYEATVPANVPVIVFGDEKMLSLLQEKQNNPGSETAASQSKKSDSIDPTEVHSELFDHKNHIVSGREVGKTTENPIHSLIEQLTLLNNKIIEKNKSQMANDEATTPKSNVQRISNKFLSSRNPESNERQVDVITKTPSISQHSVTSNKLPLSQTSREVSRDKVEKFTAAPEKQEEVLGNANSQNVEPSDLPVNDLASERNARHLESQISEKILEISPTDNEPSNTVSSKDNPTTVNPQTATPINPEPESKLHQREKYKLPNNVQHYTLPLSSITKSSKVILKPDKNIEPNLLKNHVPNDVTVKNTRQLATGVDPIAHEEPLQSSAAVKEAYKSIAVPLLAALTSKRESIQPSGLPTLSALPIVDNGKEYVLTSQVLRAPTPFGGSVILFNTIVPPDQSNEPLPYNKRSAVSGIELLSPSYPGQVYYTTQDMTNLKSYEGFPYFGGINSNLIRLLSLPKFSNPAS